jgi:membrane protein DedA with SNARE-associated domain
MPAHALILALDKLKDWFIALGPAGALLLSLVDSFVPVPGGPDLAVILISAKAPSLAPVTVLCAVAGAMVGSTILYLGARRAGMAALARVRPDRRDRVENLLGKYDLMAIAVAALLPPPFPFKVFNLAAGAFRLKVWRFVLAVGLGRLGRFAIEAFLAIEFGDHALDLIKQHGLEVLGGVALVALVWLGYRAFWARREAAVGE